MTKLGKISQAAKSVVNAKVTSGSSIGDAGRVSHVGIHSGGKGAQAAVNRGGVGVRAGNKAVIAPWRSVGAGVAGLGYSGGVAGGAAYGISHHAKNKHPSERSCGAQCSSMSKPAPGVYR